MATFNFQIVRAAPGGSVVIGSSVDGSIALGSIVDGDNTILLTIPYSALERMGTCVIPTAELEATDKVATFDSSGSLAIT